MQKGDLIGLISVGVILAGIGLFFALAPEAEEIIYAPVEITGSSLGGQAVAGKSKVIATAELKQAGFVTVHEAMGDAPGPLIGQSPLLAAGSYEGIEVETTGPLSPPQEYFILLFVDDGDSVYEPRIDLPVMSDGQVVKQKLSL
jgi:hypothetical protein